MTNNLIGNTFNENKKLDSKGISIVNDAMSHYFDIESSDFDLNFVHLIQPEFKIDCFENKKDYVLFPYVYAFTDEKSYTPKYLVYYGCGFSNFISLKIAISSLLSDEFKYFTICLFKDAFDTKEAANFIKKIANSIISTLKNQVFVIRLSINKKTIYYSITKESIIYSEEDVKEILDNILSYS